MDDTSERLAMNDFVQSMNVRHIAPNDLASFLCLRDQINQYNLLPAFFQKGANGISN